MRPVFLIGFFLLAALARADRADDLVRIHIEALGGRARIAALVSLRARGVAIAGEKKVAFTLLAARPDRVRLETGVNGRTLVQVSDGQNPPWEFDTGSWPPRYRLMDAAAAKVFAADAEFDDPLVAGATRGFSFDYGGEVDDGGEKRLRVLVTRKLAQTYLLFVDPDSYLIAARVEERTSIGGRTIKIVTRYEDYRPVNGVLLPHRITVTSDGHAVQETRVEQIEANPELADDAFAQPASLQADAAGK